MTREEIFNDLIKALAEHELGKGVVTLSTPIFKLHENYDDLDTVVLWFTIEEVFQIEIDDLEIERAVTVGDIVSLIERLKS